MATANGRRRTTFIKCPVPPSLKAVRQSARQAGRQAGRRTNECLWAHLGHRCFGSYIFKLFQRRRRPRILYSRPLSLPSFLSSGAPNSALLLSGERASEPTTRERAIPLILPFFLRPPNPPRNKERTEQRSELNWRASEVASERGDLVLRRDGECGDVGDRGRGRSGLHSAIHYLPSAAPVRVGPQPQPFSDPRPLAAPDLEIVKVDKPKLRPHPN